MLNYCANGPSGYNLTNSLRFRRSVAGYLSRTPVTSNRKTWTWSGWVKRGLLGNNYARLFTASDGTGNNEAIIGFQGDNTISVYSYIGAYQLNLTTTQVFRDPSAWYHVVVALDTTQATASNRCKVYINGSQITAFSTATYPAQNYDGYINLNQLHTIAYDRTTSESFDGYMTEINFIDGQALTPSSFGSTNSTTGVWQPAKYTGTYGTNGFYLPFGTLPSSTYAGSFNGSSQYLTVPDNASWDFGTGDFTIETFLYSTVTPSTSEYSLVSNYLNSTTGWTLQWKSTGLAFYVAGSANFAVSVTVPLNQWNHIAVTRSGTTLNIYLNGVNIGNITNSTNITGSTSLLNIGKIGTLSAQYTNGLLSNVRIVKGTALYTGSTYVVPFSLTAVSGTQLLTLQNSTIIDNSTNAYTITNNGSVTTTGGYYPYGSNALGKDSSGNNNNWATNNINGTTSGTTYDSMTDVPTLTSATVANYGTFNPLNALNTTTTDANLGFSMSASPTQTICGTFGMNSGKWYFEFAFTSAGSSVLVGGIVGSEYFVNATRPYQTSTGYMYIGSSGNKINNNTGAAYGSTYTTNDIIGVAVDLDNGKIWFSKNGTWQASGDPAAGTNPAYTGLSGTYVPSVTNGNDGVTYAGWINCGQRPFTYTPPTGFNRLNTYNLPTSTIVQGNKYMDVATYTGTGATLTITDSNSSFKPDFIWTKCRSNAVDHCLVDSVRGGNKILYSNLSNNEDTASFIDSFNTGGYTINSAAGGGGNTNTRTYVGWQWNAGSGSTSSNTNGSTTSTVSVNATAGFSIVTWTGNGSNATVGHGLGVTPKMLTLRPRTVTGGADWPVYHANLTSAQYAVFLNTTIAQTSYPTIFNSTAPTSSVLSVGTGYNINAAPMIAYVWAEISGFSKFGSYTGNGSSDGPFTYLGFRPKFVMVKNISTGGYPWVILDSSRDTYNYCHLELYPNTSGAEVNASSAYQEDFLSNGFKIRQTDATWNANGSTYIYAAFAENPFKNALAR